MREVAVEEKELEDAVWRYVSGVDLTVCLEGCAATEEADLLEILIAGVFALRAL